MPQRIDQDTNRFKQIVRGRIKGHLRKFMQQGELIGRRGKNLGYCEVCATDVLNFVASIFARGDSKES